MDGWHVFLMAIMPISLTLACDRWRGRLRLPEMARELLIGCVFGLAGIAMFPMVLAGPYAGVPFCDACVTVSSLWFGVRAGLGTTVLIVVTRLIASLLGLPAGLSDISGTATVGVFVIAVSRYLFRGKRPAVVPAAILAALTEVLHLAVLFLAGGSGDASSLDFLIRFVCTVPAFCALAAFGAAVVSGSWGTWRQNFLSAATGVAVFYALALGGTLKVGLDSAERKTRALLEYAEDDLRGTIDEMVDALLKHLGHAIVAHLGNVQPKTITEMQALARLFDLDELNLVNREGYVIGSNLKETQNAYMPDAPRRSGRFMVLTNGVTEVFSQSFRAAVDTPDVVYKYLGVAFLGGNGYLQLGYEENRLARTFAQMFDNFFCAWRIGERGYYICADRSGRIVLPSVWHLDITGKSLAEIGIDLSEIPPPNTGATFVQTIFGERCYCRLSFYAQHLIFSIVPATEYYGPAMQSVFAAVAILFVVFVVFGYAIGFMVAQNRRIAELRKFEDGLRERDLKMARAIQTSVLPTVFPPFSGETRIDLFASMEAAKEVGGDFYDFYRLDPDHLMLVIADVSGKGVSAAMFMMRARVLLKSLCTAGGDLVRAVTATNEHLSDGNEADMFVTAWVGMADLRTGEVTYVNAGHNSPYVRRADGRLEKLEFLSGPMLAAFGESTYRSGRTKLDPGDMLVLYTDGITETINDREELYGEARLEETIVVSRGSDAYGTCTAIRNAVGAFAAGTPQADDITLLAFAYRGRGEPVPGTDDGRKAV